MSNNTIKEVRIHQYEMNHFFCHQLKQLNYLNFLLILTNFFNRFSFNEALIFYPEHFSSYRVLPSSGVGIHVKLSKIEV